MTQNASYAGEMSQNMKEEVGKRLSSIRISRNITQKALADDAGIGLRTLRRLETGQSSTLDTFLRVAISLDLADDLLSAVPLQDRPSVEHADLRPQERKRARTRKPKVPEGPWAWNDGLID